MTHYVYPDSLKTGTVSGEKKAGRNDPCPCGSGEKYKRCHALTKGERMTLKLNGKIPAPGAKEIQDPVLLQANLTGAAIAEMLRATRVNVGEGLDAMAIAIARILLEHEWPAGEAESLCEKIGEAAKADYLGMKAALEKAGEKKVLAVQ